MNQQAELTHTVFSAVQLEAKNGRCNLDASKIVKITVKRALKHYPVKVLKSAA